MSKRSRPNEGTIRVLSESLANKIAAGEVVERPASVVKELVENSIDAGASRIEVLFEGGGSDLIEVVDDGAGMSFEDAGLCLDRHATSKLRSAEDLFAISSLGFRGEALPSIAAVSEVEILTRRQGDVSGTLVRSEGGRVSEHVEAGAPAGTRVRVKDLFRNVPARRKFLRKPSTEAAKASETLVRIALAHPEIGFQVRAGTRSRFSSPKGASLSERVGIALGREMTGHLHPVAGGLDGARVTGLISGPEISKGVNRSIYLYVNGRYVRDRSLNHAVSSAYGDMLDRGRFPVAVLFVDMPVDSVDVNVHPQKTEVRFSDGHTVYKAVASAVSAALRVAGPSKPYQIQRVPEGNGPGSGNRGEGATKGFLDHRSRVLDALERFRPSRERPPGLFMAREPCPGGQPPLVEESPSAVEAGFFGGLRVIGQLGASYIVCEGADCLVLVDQHAAHERLAFERLRKARLNKRVPTQALLSPRTIELPAGQMERIEEHLDVLAEAGFDISSMGGDSLACRGVPAEISGDQADRVLLDLLDELTSLGVSSSFERAVDQALSTVACHSAVRAGRALSTEECSALLERLDEVDFGANCPHGRPVTVIFSTGEIERRFGRR